MAMGETIEDLWEQALLAQCEDWISLGDSTAEVDEVQGAEWAKNWAQGKHGGLWWLIFRARSKSDVLPAWGGPRPSMGECAAPFARRQQHPTAVPAARTVGSSLRSV